jgi:hypothetical protein
LQLLVAGIVFQSSYGITLLNGRFETTTDVQILLDLALDVADMRATDDSLKKRQIYENVRPDDLKQLMIPLPSF